MKKNRYKKLLAAVTMSAIVLSAVPVYAAAQNLESFEKNASLTLKRESSVSICLLYTSPSPRDCS